MICDCLHSWCSSSQIGSDKRLVCTIASASASSAVAHQSFNLRPRLKERDRRIGSLIKPAFHCRVLAVIKRKRPGKQNEAKLSGSEETFLIRMTFERERARTTCSPPRDCNTTLSSIKSIRLPHRKHHRNLSLEQKLKYIIYRKESLSRFGWEQGMILVQLDLPVFTIFYWCPILAIT